MSAIDRAWQWFVDGLAEAVAASLDRFVRPPSYRIAVGEENVVHDSAGCTLGRLAVAAESAQFETRELAARLKRDTIDINLPAQWLWRRSLQPVGIQSAPYLDAFVQHHIERISPWRMGDVYYKIITCPLPDDPSRLAVDVAVEAEGEEVAVVDAYQVRRNEAAVQIFARSARPLCVGSRFGRVRRVHWARLIHPRSADANLQRTVEHEDVVEEVVVVARRHEHAEDQVSTGPRIDYPVIFTGVAPSRIAGLAFEEASSPHTLNRLPGFGAHDRIEVGGVVRAVPVRLERARHSAEDVGVAPEVEEGLVVPAPQIGRAHV